MNGETHQPKQCERENQRKGKVKVMNNNEYIVTVEEMCTGIKIYIGSPNDVEYHLNIVNAVKMSDKRIKRIVKNLVELVEGVCVNEYPDVKDGD